MIKLVNPTELKNIRLMAIDIGNSGGFCMNWEHSGLEVIEMRKEHRDRWWVVENFKPTIIVAEDVHTFAGQGLVSSGTLMQNRGEVIGWASSIGAKLEWIQPLEWIQCYTLKRKKHFKNLSFQPGEWIHVGATTWKKHLLQIAQTLVNDALSPAFDVNLKTADALLIWNYWASKMVDRPIKPMSLI